MSEKHRLLGGKLHVYRRGNGKHWQCSTCLNGKNWRTTTKEESLSHAKEFAEDWFFELKGKSRAGQLKRGKTFREAASQFLSEYEVITSGERNLDYVESLKMRLRVHLLPFSATKRWERLLLAWCRNTGCIVSPRVWIKRRENR